ncbi:uncharacterized protein Triagg1_8072 [Trichoderma aggressivum f. europaeum]|uniref:DUF7735 domain-containing protein n=1 Tax=Trichoderma aggressivum f. europaeum TaxID=173218 RepID=A0AAE1M263_9HYPO|nr:hypothetical protein Triagg1_8072 [Trichoderma aggressivum f. europaeum]
MHSNAVLLLTFVASASAAIDFMAIPHVRRELNLPRATPINEIRDTDPNKCVSEALSFVKTIPTPPPEIVSDLSKNPQTDPCKVSFPSSLSAEYSSYSSEVVSWLEGHKDELTSLASDCSVLSSYTSLVNVCSAGGSSGSGSGPNTASAAPTESGADSASKTAGDAPKSTNGVAARETGMAIAALAAAGIAAIL